MAEVEQALLDAILADPDDDGPREVYADWLVERGDPRGELIACEVRLARLPRAAPEHARIEARIVALRERLKAVLPPGTHRERGFPRLLPV